MKVTLGGERLGSGNKQKISMRNYERSTHDLGYTWRSSMASGTLVPFMSELALPGDTHDIELNMQVLTLPTIGPLFGSYKVQADIFLCPMRIYNGKLHMNMLNIGNDMAQAKMPLIQVYGQYITGQEINDNSQINASCILSYLGIRGLGLPTPLTTGTFMREFNAIPHLAYWDIYKQYYANKQEERGFVIHNAPQLTTTGIEGALLTVNNDGKGSIYDNAGWTGSLTVEGTSLYIEFDLNADEPEPDLTKVMISRGGIEIPVVSIFESYRTEIYDGKWEGYFWNFSGDLASFTYIVPEQNVTTVAPYDGGITLHEFPLENIDLMRMKILKDVESATAFKYGTDIDTLITPYYLVNEFIDEDGVYTYSKQFSQEGLGIKTYQSDLFNNWISTEWIDGAGGVNEISSVSTAGDTFTIDALNLASKVYVMLNRIALSGGTYDDWMDAVYTHERAKSMENPAYQGSLIKELTFEEVVGNASSSAETSASGEAVPLGELAGRGVLTNKHKGGYIRVKVDEPSYIMGIVSITPRIDYSQGNKWDMNIKNWSQLHAPALDAIGFEDLITDQMAWFDTTISSGNVVNFNSAGKQPAWINYMTNVNRVYGHFAEKNNAMYMTLNRRYEIGELGGIDDLTTYVDPTKYNHIFADTRLDAQNFWVQIRVDNTARRKMSAKVIPNL